SVRDDVGERHPEARQDEKKKEDHRRALGQREGGGSDHPKQRDKAGADEVALPSQPEDRNEIGEQSEDKLEVPWHRDKKRERGDFVGVPAPRTQERTDRLRNEAGGRIGKPLNEIEGREDNNEITRDGRSRHGSVRSSVRGFGVDRTRLRLFPRQTEAGFF